MAMRPWWSKRWMEVFQTGGMTSRFSRGRAYAREGRVISIGVDRGVVTASVQGSRKRPYTVKIQIDPLSEIEWKKVVRVLAGEAGLLADVLSGILPEDLERALASEGVSLFPRPAAGSAQIRSSCSCPDWANPCKHVSAVYYVLLDLLDSDPILTFTLRGKPVKELVADVWMYRSVRAGSAGAAHLSVQGISLPAKHVEFWTIRSVPSPIHEPGGRAAQMVAAALNRGIEGKERIGVTSLPPLPYADRDSLGRKMLEQIYELASEKAREMSVSNGTNAWRTLPARSQSHEGEADAMTVQNLDGERLAVYQFKVTLEGIAPPVWRRFQVTNDITLHRLHLILQDVMGWSNDHLYEFVIRKVRYGHLEMEYGSTSKNAEMVRLCQGLSRPRTKISYLYDFGDCWKHEVVLEKVLPPGEDVAYPVCLEGARACPPEDCGGIGGYERLQEILSDPEDEEYEEMKAFDVGTVNRALGRYRKK